LLADYSQIGLLLVVAIFFAVFTLLIPLFLSLTARLEAYFRRLRLSLPRFLQIVPYKPNPVKSSTFECGMETIGKAWVQFNFRYYFYALLFIAFDVLVVFLYPWAVALRGLGLFGFIGVLIFIFILIIGYIYAWK
jgi:NADH-quinone oxidoreductase subunit A